MNRSLVILTLFAFTATSAQSATIYQMRSVAHLLATTPGIVSQTVGGRLQYTVKGTSGVGGFADPSTVDDGYLSDGQEVLIVPLGSGGSGGVFTALLWTNIGGAWKFVGSVPSNGHLRIYVNEGKLVIVTPIYRDGDPQCCPSKYHYAISTLAGVRLKTLEGFDAP